MENPRPRFSRRVENYIGYRPRYPQAIIDLLQRECHLTTTPTFRRGVDGKKDFQ